MVLLPPRQAELPPPTADRYDSMPLLNQRAPLLGFTITFMICSWICSIFRLYVRLLVQRAPGWDDFFIVATILSTTIGSIALCMMTDLGAGKPAQDLAFEELGNVLKAVYIGTSTYSLSSTFIKVALLLQYLRVFTTQLRIRVLCKLILVLSVLSGVTFAVCGWFSCYPIAAFWDKTIKNPHCWGFASRDRRDFMIINITQVVTSATLDLMVFLIPAWLYFQPGTVRAARLSMCCLFVLGLCANLCSILRAVYIIKRTAVEEGGFDPSWDNPTVMGLASFEVHLATICAALPIFWPVLKETWNRIFVTFEVSVTQEYREFPSRDATGVELQSASSERNLALDSTHEPEGGWEPFVGDETTGLGKNKTVVESAAAGKWSRRVKDII